jgi:hypothetical protein
MAFFTQRSASLQMRPDNTAPGSPKSSSNSGADFHTPFLSPNSSKSSYTSQGPQEAVDNAASLDDQLEYGNHIEIKATDGFQRVNLNTTLIESSPCHILTFNRQHNSNMLVQDGLKWEQETFDLKPTWSLEPSADAVANVATKALRCLDPISTTNLLNKPFLAFQGAFNKLFTITWNNDSYPMRLSLPVDPIFKIWSEVSTLALLRTKTTIPVPNVISHSSSR